ncbi:MAG TPA: response regulator [Verrucomicrobiae bacterium]
MSENLVSTGPKKFILIVEDSLPQAVVLRRLLEQSGYEVVHAHNGAEALDLLALQLPHLIISDVMMPILDGYTLCKRCKADDRLRDIPFMLLTSLADPQDIFKGLETGANYYSIKPYDGAKVMARVHAILDDDTQQYRFSKESGVKVSYGGHRYQLNVGHSQILDLLLATFENIVRKNQELLEANFKLTEAMEANKTLHGLLPICGYCKKIRDDQGYWNQVEKYLSDHVDAKFSHGICPTCFEKTVAALALKDARREGSAPAAKS